ncbi:hypothetical protein CspeluHIS016_0304980 [Cutaneotrichosporon spelunceum]|uniref:3-beta hydroxysteroid dehydrogenase/isomerase domain-containing protein n=1 Tax=Cutaneotrichosporon spelunceum TaxID=1672016 RepID=A0AAD3TU34_9TREE|nr:hypothetical protein CspeluHIS016_0304980 [Cutaneotrichosporon spelunceum]
MSTSPPTHDNYLVIGGCGFLGRHIVDALLGRGETNVAVFDIVQRHFDENVTFYTGDISKLEDVAAAIAKSGAMIVIHTASPPHGRGAAVYEAVNVTGTQNVIEACRTAAVPKLVYTSSAGVVYSGKEDLINADERLPYPAVPMDAYNDTKARAEALVLAANSDDLLTCALRPSGIFGPGDRQAISGFHSVIKNGQTKFQIGSNENLFDWTYVGNVAHAHLLAADRLDQTYPVAGLHEPLPWVNLSLPEHRIPNSEAHPLGPNTSPTQQDLLVAQRFESGETDPADLRPVLRSKMDQFAELADQDDDAPGPRVAGQAFFINNCEPVAFWDFTRAVWAALGHIPPYTIVLPAAVGLVLATLAEIWAKLVGKEPGFTRFRVTFATQQRYYDSERARRLLGYKPIVGITEGLDLWTKWYAEELKTTEAEAESAKTK